MTDTTDAGAAETFVISLPDSWDDLPVDEEGFRRNRRELRAAAREEGIDPTDRRRLEVMLDQLFAQIRAERVTFAATSSARARLDDGTGRLITAAASLAGRTREELRSTAPLTAGLLARGLGRDKQDDGPIDLEPPTVASLPVGPACHLRRLQKVRHQASVLEFFAESWLVPYDDGERLCILQLLTPNLAYSREFSGLFGEIARTLQILGPEDEVDLTPAGARGGSA